MSLLISLATLDVSLVLVIFQTFAVIYSALIISAAQPLSGATSLLTLEHISQNNVKSQVEISLLPYANGESRHIQTGSRAISVTNVELSNRQENSVLFQSTSLVTISIGTTGQLTAKCAGDSNSQRTWTVIRGMYCFLL